MSQPITIEEDKKLNPFEKVLVRFRSDVSLYIMQQLVGRILTVIDSAITEEKQNKAVKDLIKGHFADSAQQMENSFRVFMYRVAKKENKPIKSDENLPYSVPGNID